MKTTSCIGRAAGLAVLTHGMVACYGGRSTIDSAAQDGGQDTGTDSADADSGGDDSDGVQDAAVGPSGLARLTRVEYERTVTAIFGEALIADVDFEALPADGKIGRFESNAGLNVNIDSLDAYRLVAENLGEAAAARAPELLGCEESPQCVDAFVRRVGALIYRRPLSDAETTVFVQFWNGARTEGSPADAMRLLVTAWMQTPDFLYRLEKGSGQDEGEVRRLTGYELASRLSFFVWKSGPDAALIEAAEAGELDTVDGVRAQAERLLDDPRADYTIWRFHASWLGIDGLDAQLVDNAAFPEFEALRDDMIDETEQFILHLFREGDAQVSTLFAADYSFPSPALTEFYGAGAGSVADDGSVALEPKQRRGVLTHASYLTAHARTPERAPIYRGKSMLVDVFCKPLPPPPDVGTAIEYDSTRSAREQIEEGTSGPACAGCHNMINPLGFLFENYDGIGRWRTMDGEFPVDAVAEIIATDINGQYADAPALMSKVAQSPEVAACVARQWMRFALSRPEENLDEGSIGAASEQAGGDMRELIIAITQTDAFRHRRLPQ